MRTATGLIRRVLARAKWRLVRAWYTRSGAHTVSAGDAEARIHTGNDYSISELLYFEANESRVAERLVDRIRPNDVVYDVGANVGIYTALAADVLDGGEVISFEPFPPNLETLENNVALAGGNVRVLELALTDETGRVGFTSPTGRRDGYGIASMANGNSGGFSVAATSVDALVNEGEVPAPNVVKIDVEGAEGRVLNGMEAVLAGDTVRCVLCEIHWPSDHRRSLEEFGDSKPEIESFLRSHGFAVSTVEEGRHEAYVFAEA